MDRQRCMMNPEHFASFLCGCAVPQVALCPQCLTEHMAQPAAHSVVGIRTQSLPLRVPLSSAFVCQMCNQQHADEFCCCRYPVTLLCKVCQLAHFQKGVGEAHLFMPAEFKAKMTSQDEVGRLRQYLFNLSDGKGRLMAVVAQIAHCQEAIKARRDRVMADFAEHARVQLDALDSLKQKLTAEVESAVEKTREQLFQQQAAGDDLMVLLWKSTKGLSPLSADLFAFQARDSPVDCDSLLSVTWESRLDLSGKLLERFENRNSFAQKSELTAVLLSQDFPTIEQLSQTCRQTFGHLITEEGLMSELVDKIAVQYYKSHLFCLKAKDEVLLAELSDLSRGKDAWTSSLISRYRDKCGSQVSRAAVDFYIPGLKLLAEKIHGKEPPQAENGGNGEEFDHHSYEKMAYLERVITDYRTKLTEVIRKTEKMKEEQETTRREMEETRKALETAVQVARDMGQVDAKLSEVTSAYKAETDALRASLEQLKEQQTGLEATYRPQFEATSRKLESESSLRKKAKQTLERKLQELDEKCVGLINATEAAFRSEIKEVQEWAAGLKGKTHMGADTVKQEVASMVAISDQKCRQDLKNDIEENETFLRAVIAQDKTDLQKKMQSMQQDAFRHGKLWGVCGDCLSALTRTTVSEEVVMAYECMFIRLLSERETVEYAHYLSRNLATYIRSAPLCVKTDDQIMKLLPLLEKLAFSEEEMKNSNSLAYILTRPHSLPLDLAVLLDEFRMPESKPMLAEVRIDHIRTFNCSAGTWGKKIVLHTPIRVDHRSSSIFLPSGHVLICGGLAANEWLADAYDIDPLSGVAVQLKSMIYRRARLGLAVYYTWVYAFGGWAGSALRSCERFSLARGCWEPLSCDMITARDYFSPCVYRHSVYLCGGSNTIECEKLDLATNKFAPLFFVMAEASFNRAVVLNDELLVLSESKLTRRSLLTDVLTSEQPHASYRANGSMMPVVFGSSLWCLSHSPSGTVYCVSTQTGEVQRDYPYPS